MEAYGTACGPDDTSVENGQCMSYTVSAPLSMACFSAGTDVLNATTDQIDDLRAAVLGVWSNCADLTTQVRFKRCNIFCIWFSEQSTHLLWTYGCKGVSPVQLLQWYTVEAFTLDAQTG